jgi:chromosome segregation ATPase
MATTKEHIWKAADDLTAEGINPTLANVRERLGGGSYTDISQHMQVWRANRQAAPIREPAPAAIADRLGELAGEIWAIALEIANSRLQAEREALEQARQEMEASRQEAADLADQLSADLETAQGKSQRQAEALATATAEIERLRVELRAQKSATDAANHRAEIADVARQELQARVNQLANLFHDEQVTRQQADKEATQQRETVAMLRTRLEAVEAHIEQERAVSAKAEEETAKTRKEAESARIAEQAVQARLESAAREIEQLREQIRDERESGRRAIEESAELRGRLAAIGQESTSTPEITDAKSTSNRRSRKTD